MFKHSYSWTVGYFQFNCDVAHCRNNFVVIRGSNNTFFLQTKTKQKYYNKALQKAEDLPK